MVTEIGPFEIQKHSKTELFEGQISNGFWQNGSHLSGFQKVELPDFRSHSNSNTVGAQIPDTFRFWMVESSSDVEWFGIRMPF